MKEILHFYLAGCIFLILKNANYTETPKSTNPPRETQFTKAETNIPEQEFTTTPKFQQRMVISPKLVNST